MIIAKRGWHLLHISGTLIHVWNCHSSFSLRCSHASVIVSFFIRGWAHFVNAMLDFRIGSQKSYFKKWLGLFFRFICFLFQKLSIFTFTLDLAFFSLEVDFHRYNHHFIHIFKARDAQEHHRSAESILSTFHFSFSIFFAFHTKYENSLFIRFGQKNSQKWNNHNQNVWHQPTLLYIPRRYAYACTHVRQ